MRLFAGRVATVSNSWLLALGVSITISLGVLQPVYAVQTQVNVDVNGSTAPDLRIEGSTSAVSSMPIVLTGDISNLTQIRIFVDGIYTDTIPLTPTDTSFTYSLWVSAGTHTVKFVGISAYTSTDVEQVITVKYVPPTEAAPQHPGSINSGSNSRTNGIIIGNVPTEDTPVSPNDSHGGVTVPQWIVQLLVPLDIVNPAQVNETPHTLGRFFLFGFGLPLLVFSRPLLLLYRHLRYSLLGWKKRPLPLFLRTNPLFSMRIIGALLLMAAFFWL